MKTTKIPVDNMIIIITESAPKSIVGMLKHSMNLRRARKR